MPADSTFQISSKEKWQLALSIVAIYLPIRIYVSNPQITILIVQNKLPFWVVELVLNILFFRVWINIIEYIQFVVQLLSEKLSFRLPINLTTFLIGGILAVGFNFFFIFFWIKMEQIFLKYFDLSVVRSEAEKNLFYLRQKSKSNTGLTVMAMLATFLLIANRRIHLNLQQIRLNAEMLERERMQAQLIALKNQLSPHFLFNNFSILASLIESDASQSVKFVNRLSASYRHILEQSGMDAIPLKKELDFIESYLFLLEARFKGKFEVNVEISEYQNKRYVIAPLTLQLLIENAIKHNQMSKECPLIISVQIQEPYLVVSNVIKLRPADVYSTGTGLRNIRNRYALLSKTPVIIENTTDIFRVKIPLLT
ncbi:Histidine kinase [Dyadobacter koreensis]|uniref:Histidine kinase n=1 Tax=Dyadobacter koreensis TaxID=408657 RepID=A0A1H6QLG1_9BACT|nr:histidine kinase [Dyadobacter koreensis]SEI41824.1 Histidine kinase [Dyadobacter koreensis]